MKRRPDATSFAGAFEPGRPTTAEAPPNPPAIGPLTIDGDSASHEAEALLLTDAYEEAADATNERDEAAGSGESAAPKG